MALSMSPVICHRQGAESLVGSVGKSFRRGLRSSTASISSSARFQGTDLRLARAANSTSDSKNRRIRAMSDESSQLTGSTSTIEIPAGFETPEPKRFTVRGDQWFAILGASLAPILRLGLGAFTSGYNARLETTSTAEPASTSYTLGSAFGRRLMEKSSPGPRPAKPLEIYEFEGCPFCRKVREMVSYLDLDVIFYPCPQGGPTYRPKGIAMGGKKQFPYMIDPNTGVSMYESDDIIKYMAEKYGDGSVPIMLSLGPVTTITAGLAMIGRGGKGSRYVPAKKPPLPLELWAYEASPFCKVVRETLNELELPHLYHAVARGSPKREELFQRVGTFQAPYLEDPNTGVKMFESAAINDYLLATYALKA